MHASTKQLLSLRDREPVAAEVRQHVAECSECQKQLHLVSSVPSLLQQLSKTDVEENSFGNKQDGQFDQKWAAVKQGVKRKKERRRWRTAQLAMAASFLFAFVIAIPLFQSNSEDNVDQIARVTQPIPLNQTEISSQAIEQQVFARNQLLARNQQLESALNELPELPTVVRGSTAYAIASFEDQIALLDYQLNYGRALGIDDSQSVDLLKNRADLLDSLYKVRYSQALASLTSY